METEVLALDPVDIRLVLAAAKGCDWCGDASENPMLAIQFRLNRVDDKPWTEYWHTRCWVRWSTGHYHYPPGC